MGGENDAKRTWMVQVANVDTENRSIIDVGSDGDDGGNDGKQDQQPQLQHQQRQPCHDT